MNFLKKIAARLPYSVQTELKRYFFISKIKTKKFESEEEEYKLLENFLGLGDWVLDIGANVGHYSSKFSELVGENGRVIAFEPIADTFSILSSNSLFFPYKNITLINAAVSNKVSLVSMQMPKLEEMPNYYEARITESRDLKNANPSFSVMTINLDALDFSSKIKLVKIDAEGHENFVISGMEKLIFKDRPVLIIETHSEEVISKIKSFNYEVEKIKGSPNIICKPT